MHSLSSRGLAADSFDGQSSRRRVAPSPLMTHRHGDPRRCARCRGVLLNRFEASVELQIEGSQSQPVRLGLHTRCGAYPAIGGSSLASSSQDPGSARLNWRMRGSSRKIAKKPAQIRSPLAVNAAANQALSPAAALGGTGSPFSAASFSAQKSTRACNSVQREFAAPKQSSRALPVPESQSAVTPVGISGSARGLGSAA